MPRDAPEAADTPNQLLPLPVSRHMRLLDLKSRIASSAYVVDPRLVAEAVVNRDGLRLLGLPLTLSSSGAHSPSARPDPARPGR